LYRYLKKYRYLFGLSYIKKGETSTIRNLEPSICNSNTAYIISVSAFKVLFNATTLVGVDTIFFLDGYYVGEIPFY
jgi:hypothetical protein